MSGTCDTSLLVAALVSWHPQRAEARQVVKSRADSVPAHALIETFSVLTRLPAPYRISPVDAADAVHRLRLRPLTLPGDRYRELVISLAAAGVRGGAVYDGVIAATAAHHDTTLFTLDRRARSTYDALGACYEMI